jgi:chemotaxis family two-component system response regulator Rcp1
LKWEIVAIMSSPIRLCSLANMPMTSDAHEVTKVLLVEDGRGDVRLIEDAFRATNPAVQMHVAIDGEEAMAFLKRGASHAHAPRPDLILLDLNLPKMHGRDVLANIKADARLKTIPVIVVTSSDAPEDIEKCHQLHANCYLTKPSQLDGLEKLVANINEFWLKNAKLPKMLQPATRE